MNTIDDTMKKRLAASEPSCCNSPREMTLHEQLSERATRHSQLSAEAERKADGYRTLCEMLPVGLTDAQQRAIRCVLQL